MSDAATGRRAESGGGARGYDRLRDGFRWRLPSRFNLGVACSDAQDTAAPALVAVAADGTSRTWTFGDIAAASNRLANVLTGMGVERGDRVGVVVPQSAETAIAHLALWKMGAVSLPLASLLGPDALAYRLSDCDARAVVSTPENLGKLEEAAPDLPVVTTGGRWDRLLGDASPTYEAATTAAEDPVFLIYTSGTTGQPKGALHAHRSLFGHLPGFECYYEFTRFAPMGRYDLAQLPHDGAPPPPVRDLMWTPADWAWIGGLMDALVPSWFFGLPVLTADHDFDPEWALRLMASRQATLAFLPPTALKMMRAAGTGGADLALRGVLTGGEPLGEAMLRWCEEELGAVPNEGYGQTECNLVVGNCHSEWPIRPGSMGRALPGHDLQVQDGAGRAVVGSLGEICVRAPDPVMMLGYWGRPDATEEKYRDGWLLTGDLGVQDEDGYLWFASRKDDVISSMGYRIGPGEIEDSLMRHPAVGMCAVIGVPDEVRGQVPAAFVVLKDDATASDGLVEELQEHVRTRLAAHEVPRRITFVDDLPRTVTGKVLRRALREVDPDRDQ